MSHPRPALPDLSPALARFRQHFDAHVLPLWQGPGWNAELALPYESLDAEHRPLPPQRYRAMACARQLYLFSSHLRLPGAAERAAALFRSLQRHFHDAEHGGWYYSIDAEGRPLDRRKDLYTHAFIVFACAHYWGQVKEALVGSTLDAALAVVATRFVRDDGLYEACLAEDWTTLNTGPLQNPLMHLAEAYLQVLAVREDDDTEGSLLHLCTALQAQFVDTEHGTMLEKPRGTVDNWFEPGHQFEWFYLLESSPLLRGSALHASLSRAFAYAQTHGVRDHAVVAMLNEQGQVIDPTQRIWAQAEYLRALALCSGDVTRLGPQLDAFQAQFLHDGGWHECRDGNGQISRHDMPSTTPYHLATCLEGLQRS